MEGTQELNVPRTPAFKGLDISAVGNLVAMAVMYAAVHVQLIAPQIVVLNEVCL